MIVRATPARVQTPAHRSLQAQAEAQANQAHSQRLADIAAMAPLLAQLDAFIPTLAAAGLAIDPASLRLVFWHQPLRRVKVLRVPTMGYGFDSSLAARWHAQLLQLGFTEISRDAGTCPTALLRHGSRLLVQVDLPHSLDAEAKSAAEYAARVAARAQLMQAVAP